MSCRIALETGAQRVHIPALPEKWMRAVSTLSNCSLSDRIRALPARVERPFCFTALAHITAFVLSFDGGRDSSDGEARPCGANYRQNF